MSGGQAAPPGPVELVTRAESLLHRDLAGCARLVDTLGGDPSLRTDHALRGRFARLRGEVAYLRGDIGEAGTAFEASRIANLMAGRLLEARRAHLGQASVMLAGGRLGEAADVARRVLCGLEQESHGGEELATRLHMTANRQLAWEAMEAGDTDAALRLLDLADEFARLLGDPHEVARVGLVRSRCLLAAGMANQAVDLAYLARTRFLALGADVWAARSAVVIADALVGAGQPISAIGLLEAVVRPLEGQYGALDDVDLARSGALLAAGLAAEALAAATSARDAFAERGLMGRFGRACHAMGRAALRLGRTEEARDALTAAALAADDCGMRRVHEEIRLLRAALELADGNSATADRIARDLMTSAGHPLHRVHAQLMVARATTDVEEAGALVDAASAAVDRLGLPSIRLALRIERAHHLRRLGDRAAAVAELRTTLSTARPHGSGSTNQLDPYATPARTADELIRMLIEDGSNAAVVEAWQRIRAVKRGSVAALQTDVVSRAGGEVSATASVGAIIESALDALGSSAVSRPSLPENTTVPDRAAIEYYVLGNDVACVVIRDGLLHARLLPGAGEVSARLSALWQQECGLLAAVGPRPGTTSSSILDSLFGLLVEPVAEWLADLEGEPLAVWGHRHLHSIPFEAMLEVGAPWRTRLPGGNTIADAARMGPVGAPPATALVLAVPTPETPAMADEAEMIATLLPAAEVYVGESATSGVLARRHGAVDIVHIAAHGRFRNENPLSSAVELGDGWLTAADVIDGRADVAGSVVVLSSCASGRGSGRMLAPVGMVWACEVAGAAGVVAALWPVDDAVTLDLMGHFYAELAVGQHPRTALALAQRMVAKRFPHPFYWAAFQYFTPPC